MDGVKKILVVDDEADICNILKFNLDKAGNDKEIHRMSF